MLPSILARHISEGINGYIEALYPISTEIFASSFRRLRQGKNFLFHDPYFSIKLPIRPADNGSLDIFTSLRPQYHPHAHQARAFKRLLGDGARSTLVATGTGSGKTECYAYPILEYCYDHRLEPGIKAIIIYPLNVLAADQAKRLARIIYSNEKLKGNVSVGMFIGGLGNILNTHMTRDEVIANHEVLRQYPPSVLITNYKTLNYLMVRPKYSDLWKNNGPQTLKYVAVDELHSFDGAQGTDLACLLRRLKSRLNMEKNYLCCVGTSATMGGQDQALRLREYAAGIFGEPFDPDSVVVEDRFSAHEFLANSLAQDFTVPNQDAVKALAEAFKGGDPEGFLQAAVSAWLEKDLSFVGIMGPKARLELGQRLMGHNFTRHLLSYLDGKYVQIDQAAKDLCFAFPALAKTSDPALALDAIVALISHARGGAGTQPKPFLNVDVQLWLKELSSLLAKVSDSNVTYALAPDLKAGPGDKFLPVITCRDCGATGWGSVIDEKGGLGLGGNLSDFYKSFFKSSDKVRIVYPCRHQDVPKGLIKTFLCPKCLKLVQGENLNPDCSFCGRKPMEIAIATNLDLIGEKTAHQYVCPHCRGDSGLMVLGLRSAAAISLGISLLFSSRFNDDKKTLAFSDNVQDAAHLAGFFNSRLWWVSLKGSIQRFVANGGEGLNLDDFPKAFVKYWSDNLSKEEFVAMLIPPNLTWKRAYGDMLRHGFLSQKSDGANLLNAITKRLGYEILLEYGKLSLKDQTLVNSGSSTLFHDPETIGQAALGFKERLSQFTQLPKDPKTYERILTGILHLMKVSGAIDDEVFRGFAQHENKWYLTNDYLDWLPGWRLYNEPKFVWQPMGSHQSVLAPTSPLLQSTQSSRPRAKFHKLFDSALGKGRYRDWIASCLGDNLGDPDLLTKIAEAAFLELSSAKLIVSLPTPNNVNIWALSKEALFLTTKVAILTCPVCRRRLWVGSENAGFWVNAPCPYCLKSELAVTKAPPSAYFKKVYESGDFFRVLAREHTGIMSRQDLEALEIKFKLEAKERQPWHPNLLSCTPTLEMGLDIGDLSSVILCGVPPSHSSYAQRAGRAGRRDGNSLTVTLVSATARDLYFDAAPLEIMAAPIEPPKIFLKASAILERQFVAFCLDGWVKAGARENAVPKTIEDCLVNPNRRSNRFPRNFLGFVDTHVDKLLSHFLALFPELSEEGDDLSEDIERFAKGSFDENDSMSHKIQGVFDNFCRQCSEIKSHVQRLEEAEKRLMAQPIGENNALELEDLGSEKDALISLFHSITSRDVFKFLSDEGLLPNYAFPESGVAFNGLLYGKEKSSETSKPGYRAVSPKKETDQNQVFEFNRPSSLAITELAPGNSFYAGGHRFDIDRLDLNTDPVTKWRLCPSCSHIQLEGADQNTACCPCCGSPMWMDSGQERSLIKVSTVFSTMDRSRSLIGDETETRKRAYYLTKTLVDINENAGGLKTFTIKNDKFNFGYEFIDKAIVRDINFGKISDTGDLLTIQGQKIICKGFVACKHCGTVQRDDLKKPIHSSYCQARYQTNDQDSVFTDKFYLYRELSTQAMRILVPATTLERSNIILESFVAAFKLGLKAYFGNVDHLRYAVGTLPVPGSNHRKQFLIVHDGLPGGTGYLKQLTRERHSMISILEKALSLMENCQCREDPNKDGCYRCLYGYKQNHNVDLISRTKAIEIIKQILSGRNNLMETEGGLSKIGVKDLLESELERRFIESFTHMSTGSRPINLTRVMIREKRGFQLEIESGGEKMVWVIEPQVELGPENGVSRPTVPDFVFWPATSKGDLKPVAIYTDGFAYHKDKVTDDTLKRAAVVQSGKFLVWSLTWSDVEGVLSGQGNPRDLVFNPASMPSGHAIYRIIVNENSEASSIWPEKASAMELLVYYLENQKSPGVFKSHGRGYAYGLLDQAKLNDRLSFEAWLEARPKFELTRALTRPGPEPSFGFKESLFGSWRPHPRSHIEILAGFPNNGDRAVNKELGPFVWAILEDRERFRQSGYEEDWKEFWHFSNVMQFSKRFMALTRSGLEDSVYGSPLSLGSLVTPGWDQVMDLIIDPKVKDFVKKCSEMNLPVPDAVGLDLTGSDGAVIGEAELTWSSKKVALLLSDKNTKKSASALKGWRIITIDDKPTLNWFIKSTKHGRQ
ncbi:MAG: DEAD/DEAH box helicase [Deltaproteobacteria bacterium]|jgi:DEAD/DEAH box helicase domain-containing protein|nr:DEAD/DEAH box helicase [Deltaproteobacteria bacterium]